MFTWLIARWNKHIQSGDTSITPVSYTHLAEHRTKKLLPTREEVRTALEEKLKDMQANGPAPDVLTLSLIHILGVETDRME